MPVLEERAATYRVDDFGLWNGDYVVTDKVSEECLAAAYIRFKAEGLLDRIFHESVPSLSWFLERFTKAKGVEVLACFKKGEDGQLDLGGTNWFNQRTSVGGLFDKAECGHGYFRKYHDLKSPVIWSRLGIEFSFQFLGVSALFGATPVPNRAAVLAARRIGFELAGPIPMYTVYDGLPCGAYITSMTKDRWREL